jgi:DNA-binding FrmR family transcriptional regulator
MICDKDLMNRIKRTKGQMQGVLDMMEQNQACLDIVIQLKAIRASIDQSIGILTTENLKHVLNTSGKVNEKDIQEAMQIILKGR